MPDYQSIEREPTADGIEAKRRKRNLILLGAVLLVVGLGVLLAVVFWPKSKSKDDLQKFRHLLTNPATLNQTAPPELRGISLSWILQFSDVAASLDPTMATRDVVSRYVVPLTAAKGCPIFTMVPSEFQGDPTFFISHAWSDNYYNPMQGQGIIDIIKNTKWDIYETYIWLDIFSVNQHQTTYVDQQLNNTLNTVKGVRFCMDKPILFSRSWCLYELVNSYGVVDDIEFFANGHTVMERRQYLKDILKTLAVSSSENAQAFNQTDKTMIDGLLLEKFGSFEAADEYIKTLVLTYLWRMAKRNSLYQDIDSFKDALEKTGNNYTEWDLSMFDPVNDNIFDDQRRIELREKTADALAT